jgi:hypothetical protein
MNMGKSGFYISNDALYKAQRDDDYFWMMTYWKKRGITHTSPTPALRQYAFIQYIKCKRIYDTEIAEGAVSTNKPIWSIPPSMKIVDKKNHDNMRTWHNITVFLHCIISHPLYSELSITKLQTGDISQQLTELN